MYWKFILSTSHTWNHLNQFTIFQQFFYMPQHQRNYKMSGWLCVFPSHRREQVEWELEKGVAHTSKQILIRYSNMFSKEWSLCASMLLHVITSYSRAPPWSAACCWLTRRPWVSFCWVSPLPATRESLREWKFLPVSLTTVQQPGTDSELWSFH